MEANTEAKRTPAELISLDHYASCQYCSDPDRGFCAEGDRLEQACIAAGQVCPNCDAMSEDGGLCWYCHDEQKAKLVREQVAFKLSSGRVVGIHADVAGFHNFISYQLADGSITVAERVVLL